MNNIDKEHYHPANNPNWEWRWMGLSCPSLNYIDNKDYAKLQSIYGKYMNTFNVFFGIGDFTCWDKNEILKLTDDEKVEFLNLLLNNEKHDVHSFSERYIGLVDGELNKEIDEFSNKDNVFLKRLTIDECRCQEYPHNSNLNGDGWFYCYDCGNKFESNSQDYIKVKLISDISIELHNITVDYNRNKIDIPITIIELEERCNKIKKLKFFEKNSDDIFSLKEEIEKFKNTDESWSNLNNIKTLTDQIKMFTYSLNKNTFNNNILNY